MKWTRLSCLDFIDNQVCIQLSALAYSLGNFLKRLSLPKSVKKWSLRILREKLTKIVTKLFKHFRYVVFQIKEAAVPRMLPRAILDQIGQLRVSPELARAG